MLLEQSIHDNLFKHSTNVSNCSRGRQRLSSGYPRLGVQERVEAHLESVLQRPHETCEQLAAHISKQQSQLTVVRSLALTVDIHVPSTVGQSTCQGADAVVRLLLTAVHQRGGRQATALRNDKLSRQIESSSYQSRTNLQVQLYNAVHADWV